MARLCQIIKERNGVSGVELQNKLNISERTRYRYLYELKGMGADIVYCRRTDCYRLFNDFDLLSYYSKYVI